MAKRKERVIIFVLGFLSAIGPFSTDTYLPGFKDIAADFSTSIETIGLSLTFYFMGISFGQLLYGPLLDRFGRKKPLIAGLVIYILSSAGCAMSQSVEWLVIMRVFQALGGCAGMVAGRAVVTDLFLPHETARIYSTLMLVMGAAPIIAPTLGGIIVASLGWRFIFILLVVLGSLMLISVSLYLPESKEADPSVRLHLWYVIKDYGRIFKEPFYLTYGIAGAVLMSSMFAYIAGSPFVFMNLFGLSAATYGWVFGSNALGLVLGSQVNRLLLKKFTSKQIALTAILIQLALVMIFASGAYFNCLFFEGTFILLFCHLFLLGIINPNMLSIAMSPFRKLAGTASALIGGTQMLMSAAVTLIVSWLHNGTSFPMAGTMAGCVLLSLVLVSVKYFINVKEPEGI